jgi:hypothetical protein
MLVRHSQPLVNPGNCPNSFGYNTNPADPGVNLFHTMLISAFTNRKEVSLLISECAWGNPRLIAVVVR